MASQPHLLVDCKGYSEEGGGLILHDSLPIERFMNYGYSKLWMYKVECL